MKRLRPHGVTTLLWLTGLLMIGSALGQESPATDKELLANPAKVARLLAENKLAKEAVPNPHWTKDGCVACHSATPTKQALALREKDVDKLCHQCHQAITDHGTIHPSGMAPSESVKARMPADYRKALDRNNGAMGCITCHNLPTQCLQTHPAMKTHNPEFLRGGPYRVRTTQCFHCHDPAQYARLNPHEQIDETGELREQLCLICHQKTPDLNTAKSMADVSFIKHKELSELCTRCHVNAPHPGGSITRSQAPADHLVIPDASYLQRMEAEQEKRDIYLPLDPGSGRIFCATCHNPHAKGVLKGDMAGRETIGKHWLRTTDICTGCHDI